MLRYSAGAATMRGATSNVSPSYKRNPPCTRVVCGFEPTPGPDAYNNPGFCWPRWS